MKQQSSTVRDNSTLQASDQQVALIGEKSTLGSKHNTKPTATKVQTPQTEADPNIDMRSEQENQRDLVFQFCRDYAHQAGFFIQDIDNEGEELGNDYEDVTGEKAYISSEEFNEMESVVYSISFGKQITQRRVTYQAFSAAIS